MGGEAIEENGMGYGVEGGGEVQQDEQANISRVGSNEEIVSDPNQGAFGTVVRL